VPVLVSNSMPDGSLLVLDRNSVFGDVYQFLDLFDNAPFQVVQIGWQMWIRR
jgi:hypothetical protein